MVDRRGTTQLLNESQLLNSHSSPPSRTQRHHQNESSEDDDYDDDCQVVPASPAPTTVIKLNGGGSGGLSIEAAPPPRSLAPPVTTTMVTDQATTTVITGSQNRRENNSNFSITSSPFAVAASSAFPAFVNGIGMITDTRNGSRDNVTSQTIVSNPRTSSVISSTMAAMASLSGGHASISPLPPLPSPAGNHRHRHGNQAHHHEPVRNGIDRLRLVLDPEPFLTPLSSLSSSSALQLRAHERNGGRHIFENRLPILRPAPPAPPVPPTPPAPPAPVQTAVSLTTGQVMDIVPTSTPTPPHQPTVERREPRQMIAREEAALILTSMRVASANETQKTVQPSSSSSPRKGSRDSLGLKLPMSSISEFEDLERKIDESDELKNKLLNRLGTIGGKNPSQCVRNGLKTLMTDSLAVNFNWAGRGGKKSFQSYEIKSVLFDAVRIAFPKVTDFQLKDPVQCWLKRSRHIQETEDLKLKKVSTLPGTGNGLPGMDVA